MGRGDNRLTKKVKQRRAQKAKKTRLQVRKKGGSEKATS